MNLDDYRPNVGIVLFNTDGLAFYGKRAGEDEPYCWQFPQGGIDKGESPADAALRELTEETGVSARVVAPLGRTEGWLTYDFPPEVMARKKSQRWRGQRQKWFAFRFLGAEHNIDLEGCHSDEFDAWRWAPLSDAPELVIPWKRAVYAQVAEAFARFARA